MVTEGTSHSYEVIPRQESPCRYIAKAGENIGTPRECLPSLQPSDVSSTCESSLWGYTVSNKFGGLFSIGEGTALDITVHGDGCGKT
jgi:hypothetical protein